MRRTFLVMMFSTLLITGLAWADDTVPAAEGGVCNGASFAAQLRAGTVENLEEIQIIEPAESVEMGGVYLNCPATSECVGGNLKCPANSANCSPTGSSTSISFGSPACELPGGSLFRCRGGRIVHLIITECEQCPCCSTNPACVCPIDCGESRILACL